MLFASFNSSEWTVTPRQDIITPMKKSSLFEINSCGSVECLQKKTTIYKKHHFEVTWKSLWRGSCCCLLQWKQVYIFLTICEECEITRFQTDDSDAFICERSRAANPSSRGVTTVDLQKISDPPSRILNRYPSCSFSVVPES